MRQKKEMSLNIFVLFLIGLIFCPAQPFLIKSVGSKTHYVLDSMYPNYLPYRHVHRRNCWLQALSKDTGQKQKTFQPPMPSGSVTDNSNAINQTLNSKYGLSRHWIARIILLTVSAFYGTNFGCVKILGEALHPGVAACLRFLIATLVFIPQVLTVARRNPRILMAGLEVGAYNAIGYFGQAQSLLSSKASNVAFICSLAVVVVPLIESLFGEKKGVDYLRSAIFPALLAVAGVGCLELGGTTVPGLGDFWALLQPVFFGLAFWRIERHIKLCTQPGDAQAFTGASMSVVALLSIFWMIHDFFMPVSIYGKEIFDVSVQSQFLNIIHDWKVPAALLWTGVVTTALTSFGENVAMKDLDAAESTVIYSTEPLWGTAFAALTLGEDIGWNTLIGAMLIIGACLWSSVGGKIIALLSSTPFFDNEMVEEIMENISTNFAKFMDNLNQPPPMP